MLSDKIWITRKSRIYAEQRLQRYEILSRTLMILYSFLLVSFSVWNLLHRDQWVQLFLVFGAIAVLASSILLSSQRFSERAVAMRNCYIRLDGIYPKAKRAEEQGDQDLIQQLESEYAAVLSNIENHSDYDYLCLRYSLRNSEDTSLPPFAKIHHANYIWQRFWRVVLVAFLFVLPIIAVVLWSTALNYVGV